MARQRRLCPDCKHPTLDAWRYDPPEKDDPVTDQTACLRSDCDH